METTDAHPLSRFNLNGAEIEKHWDALNPRHKEILTPHFQRLYSETLLDEKTALFLMQHVNYSDWLTPLFLQLHALNLSISDHFSPLSAQAYIANKQEALLKKLQTLDYFIDNHRAHAILSLEEVEAVDRLINFWLKREKFDQSRLDNFLAKKITKISAYLGCLDILANWYIYTDANEALLAATPSAHLIHMRSCLEALNEGNCLSQDLFLALIAAEEHASAISEGLETLRSRTPSPIDPLYAMTIIRAGAQAKSVAGSLSFLIKNGLASSERCEQLIRTKSCSEAIEIVCFQLTRQHGATSAHIDSVFALSRLLMEPVILDKLKRISFFSPVPLSHYAEVFRLLNTIGPDTTAEEKKETLIACATLFDPLSKLGGGLGERTPQCSMPSPG